LALKNKELEKDSVVMTAVIFEQLYQYLFDVLKSLEIF
jgi:hypothetical protein